MFIGRRKELDAMQSLYDKDGFGMMVIYGRRRIGKSTLINEFIKNKNAIFYTATKVGQNRNLELFAKQVISVLDPDFESASFPSTEDIFNFITKKLPDKKIVLVIDELPYWAEKDDSLLSILQKYIDTEWQNKNLFIILCGSALSFMEKKSLVKKVPYLDAGILRSNWKLLIIKILRFLCRTIRLKRRQSAMELLVV